MFQSQAEVKNGIVNSCMEHFRSMLKMKTAAVNIGEKIIASELLECGFSFSLEALLDYNRVYF